MNNSTLESSAEESKVPPPTSISPALTKGRPAIPLLDPTQLLASQRARNSRTNSRLRTASLIIVAMPEKRRLGKYPYVVLNMRMWSLSRTVMRLETTMLSV